MYKIHILKPDNVIDRILVFYGSLYLEATTRWQTYLENNNDISSTPLFFNEEQQPVFSEDEIDQIQEEEITVVFCQQRIYFDDTLQTVKEKVGMELKKQDESKGDISSLVHGLYLFYQQNEKLDSSVIYQTLTQGGKLKATRERWNSFQKNISPSLNFSPLEEEEEEEQGEKETTKEPSILSLDDLLALNLDNRQVICNKALGQNFFLASSPFPYPFTCNPFETTNEDHEFLERIAHKSLTTFNSNLMMDCGKIHNNILFLCLVEDVLISHDLEDTPLQSQLLQIYFPRLAQRGIHSLEELIQHQQQSTSTEKTMQNAFETIDLFYDIHQQSKLSSTPLEEKDSGITFLRFSLCPPIRNKLPLEVFFKIIHATPQTPLLKLNMSSRLEKWFRLYTEQTAKNGKKIPFIPKATLFKMMRIMGKTKSVSVYIDLQKVWEERMTNKEGVGDEGNMNPPQGSFIICEFQDDGCLQVLCQFSSPTLVSKTEEWIRQGLNPVLQEVKNYMEPNGYNVSLFDSLFTKEVAIQQMTWNVNLKSPQGFSFANMQNRKTCISEVFLQENVKQDAMQLRFKRVANFNQRNSQEAFIIERRKEGMSAQDILTALIANFPSETAQDMQDRVQSILSELEGDRQFKKQASEIKTNPGFPIQIHLKSKQIAIQVENINNIGYLDTLPVYFDTLIRLSQGKGVSQILVPSIDKLCQKNGLIAKTVREEKDIVPIVGKEQTIKDELEKEEGEDEDEDEGEGEEDDEEKMKEMRRLLFGLDEEENADESMKGGENTPDEDDDNSLASFKQSTEQSTDTSVVPKLDSKQESQEEDDDNSLASFKQSTEQSTDTSVVPKSDSKQESQEEDDDNSLASFNLNTQTTNQPSIESSEKPEAERKEEAERK